MTGAFTIELNDRFKRLSGVYKLSSLLILPRARKKVGHILPAYCYDGWH